MANMDGWHKDVVQKHYANLCDDMEPDELISHLIQRRCFTPRLGGEIKAKPTSYSRNKECLIALMKRPSEDFFKFIFALHITLQKHIMKRLLKTASDKLEKELIFHCQLFDDCPECKGHNSQDLSVFTNLPSTSAGPQYELECEYSEDDFIIFSKILTGLQSAENLDRPTTSQYKSESDEVEHLATTSNDTTDKKRRVVGPGETTSTSKQNASVVDIKTSGYVDESEATTSKDRTDRDERGGEDSQLGEIPSTSKQDASGNKEEKVDDKWYKPCEVVYYLEDGAKYQGTWELSCGVRVMETADWSEFKVIEWGSGKHFGAAGLFQKENNKRGVYFGVGHKDDDGSHCVKDHSLGEGVVMALDKKDLMRMDKAISWRENEDVLFFVKGEKKNERWEISCWFEYQGKREYIGTFRQSLDIGHPLYYNQFWSNIRLKGTSEKRSTEFFEPKLNGKLIQDAKFLNWSEFLSLESTTGCKTGSKGVMLWSGGKNSGEKGMAGMTKFKLPDK